ncbi:MAG: acetyl-CoA carboxylase biotin carboxyl carrier protein [Planctomycetes bacterium]|nr:acetyl-CoA carboxylase biotin carboxyl carrier protein [Planctomycetota bacterium]
MDVSKIKDLKDLQALVELMERHELVEVELEGDGHRIRLRKAEAPAPREVVGFPLMAPGSVLGPAAAQAAAGPAGAAAAPSGAPARASNLREVPSPMVGTFYRAPSPEAEPFVKEGDLVTADQVVCIIEAMKVMNEIPAGVAGVVREILVRNGESVEYGQPLFRVEAA